MKRRVEAWSIDKIQRMRPFLSFPDYQRQPNLWPQEKKALLIDSILLDIDIPKLYFNHTKGDNYEVVDGQQRLWAIWGYLDDQFPCLVDGKKQVFSKLDEKNTGRIEKYELQVTIIPDADDDYLRELFRRLQLGLLLITGEKLNSLTGAMKDFVFKKMAGTQFIQGVGIPGRRFAKETLCAQIAINSFYQRKLSTFARTRYEDLLAFFNEHEQPQGKDKEDFDASCTKIESTMGELWKAFGPKSKELKNRSYVLSIYLLAEELIGKNAFSQAEKRVFEEFCRALWGELKEEVKLGFDRKNRELYQLQALLSSAPGEKYQIERRHEKLREFYEHYKSGKKIKGDKGRA